MDRLTFREILELVWRIMLIVLVALLIWILWRMPHVAQLPTIPHASQLPIYMDCTPTTEKPASK